MLLQGMGATAQDQLALENLYWSLLNRAPEADGWNYWIGRLDAGMSISDITNSFKQSPEYQQLQAQKAAQAAVPVAVQTPVVTQQPIVAQPVVQPTITQPVQQPIVQPVVQPVITQPVEQPVNVGNELAAPSQVSVDSLTALGNELKQFFTSSSSLPPATPVKQSSALTRYWPLLAVGAILVLRKR